MKKDKTLKINKYLILIGISVIILSVIFFSLNNKNNDKAMAAVSELQENQLYKFDISSFSNDNKVAYLNGSNALGGNSISSTDMDFTDYSNWYITQGNDHYNISKMRGNRDTDRVSYSFMFTGYSMFTFIGGTSYTEELVNYYSGNYIAFPNTEDIYLHIGSLNRNADSTSNSKQVTNSFKNNIIRYLTLVQTNYNITYNILNGSANVNSLTPNTVNEITITPNQGYALPENITYTGTADDVQYYNETGDIIITNPTSDFTITAECKLIHNLATGYYLINPANINSNTIGIDNLEFKIVQIETNKFYFTNSEPLSVSESLITYNYIARTSGLYNGIYAFDSLGDNQSALWLEQEGSRPAQLSTGKIIHLTQNAQTISEDTDILFYLGESYDNVEVLSYFAYPIVQDNGTIAYANGVTEGINNNIISDSTSGVISAIFSGIFGKIFKMEIFPNFPLYIFLLIPIVFTILGFIFWIVRGR